MPMKLKIHDRTEIEPAFMDLMKDLWKERWTALNREIKEADPRFRPMHIKKNAVVMTRLKANCTDKAALDHEKTQLITLPYIRFWTLQHDGMDWMAGLTKPILMTDGGAQRWQGPRYTVYIPRNVFQRGTDAHFHFVPEGSELIHDRHPHHTASMPSSTTYDPLDMNPYTCWGDFGTIASACIRAGEITNLFRTIYVYLTRVNLRSLLCYTFQSTPFKQLANIEEPETMVRRVRR